MPSVEGGRYEILGKLAEGATAELFLARVAGANERVVVIKRIRRSLASNAAFVHAFVDQARMATEVQHPNLVQILEVGKLGGSYFCAMEFIDGETLHSMVLHARTSKIEFPVRAVLALAAGAAAGLHHVHERRGSDDQLLGTVHGNLSPKKLMVSRDGIVKILDFGLPPGLKRQLTYASPESCRGDAIDRRSDLFSLGVVLWELLTLDALYERANAAEMKAAIEREVPPAPSTRRYDVPQELDAIVLKLLAKDPADRFQTAADLLAALEALVAKLELPLAATDLARVVRLWFSVSKAEAAEADAELNPLVVHSEPVAAELTRSESPVDALLDSVRSDTAALRNTAAAIAARARPKRITAVPQIGDTVADTRETAEQLRNRMLAPTKPPEPAGGESSRRRPETLNPQHQYAYISNVSGKAVEPLRKSGITATPPLGTAVRDDANGASAPPNTTNAATDAKVAQPSDAAPVSEPTAAPVAKDAARDDVATAVEPEPSAEPEPAEPAPEPAKPAAAPARARSAEEPARPATANERSADERPARPPWMVPALVAAVAVVGAAVLLLTRGGAGSARSAEPSPVQSVAVTADARVLAEPPAQVAVLADAAAAVEAVDARTEIAAVVADARTEIAAVAVDARAEIPVAVDAHVAAVVVDARTEAASAPVDAGGQAVATTEPEKKHHHHHEDPTSTQDTPRETHTDERSIEELSEAGEYAKANSACAKNTLFTPKRLEVCALTACRVHDAALANRWLRAIAKAERANVAAKCTELGLPLDAPPPPPAPAPSE